MLFLKRIGWFCSLTIGLYISNAFAEPSSSPKKNDFMSEVYQRVESEIAVRLNIPLEDVTVHYLGMANAHRCDGASHVKIDIPTQEDFRGKTLLYIEAWKEDVQCGRWTVQGDVEIWGQIPTAKYATQAGEVIEVQWTRGRIDQIREPLFELTPSMQNATLLAVVPIRNGDPLHRNHVRRKHDFPQGASVIVLVQKGSLQVKVQGSLLKNAYIGDMVKVRSQSSNTILEGQITENGMVLLK